MICSACNFDNKEEAAFCAECGKPLKVMEPADQENKTTLVENPEVAPAPSMDDASEANTTVLTDNLRTPGMAPIPPQGFANGPTPVKPPMLDPTNQPMSLNMAPSAPMPPNGGKPGKAPKAPKPVKAGKSKGTIAYIVISIILILGLVGVGVWGYFHYTDKLDKTEKEKSELEASIAEKDSEIHSLTDAKSSLDDDIATLEADIATLESDITTYESQIAELESQVSNYSGYEAYDELITFANGTYTNGSSDFFASHNVINLDNGEAEVKIFFCKEGEISYSISDSSVATCDHSTTWENGNVATLYITPQGSGYAVVTVTNSATSDVIEILVYSK